MKYLNFWNLFFVEYDTMEYKKLYYFIYIMKQNVIMEAQGIISVFHQTQSLQTILVCLSKYKVSENKFSKL